MGKKTIVFDFDGVIHSYTSGYRGKTCIPDPPVEGIGAAIDEIRSAGYDVVVASTRCASAEGLDAVRTWLERQEIQVDGIQSDKPPAICYVDDRAICFDGHPEQLLEKIRKFRPWHQQKARSAWGKNKR